MSVKSVEKFKDKHLHVKDTKTLSEKKLEAQEELKKQEWELEQIDNDLHGDDFVIQTEKAKEKKEREVIDEMLNFLDEDKSITGYRERLAAIGEVKLKSIEFDKGWEYHCLSTSDGQRITVFGKGFDTKPGVVVILKDPQNRTYVGAMGVTYDPIIDHGALTTLIIQAENTYDKVRGYSLSDIQIPSGVKNNGETSHVKNESGIYVPKA